MVNCCNTHNSMDAGAGDRLYDGLFYSYPAGRCYHRRVAQSHSGAKARLEEMKEAHKSSCQKRNNRWRQVLTDYQSGQF